MTLPEGWETGSVSTGDIELQYYGTGSGPPIVLAHGLFDTGRRWVPLASDLAADYRVVAYDARGHGRSDAPETGYGIEDRVADLVGVVEGLDLRNPILLGHSMGGATAAWAAATHPGLPAGLVLADPSRFHGNADVSVEAARRTGRERLRESKALSVEERIEEYYDDVAVDAEHRRRLATAADECSLHVVKTAQEHDPVARAFDEIRCSTLVLRHDADVDDRVTDLDAADRLTDGRLVHVPDAGHYVFRDAYDAAYTELRTFLERL